MKDYLTPKETAEVLRVSPITVRVWAQKGLLKASTTAGGHRRFEREEIERFAREKGIDIEMDNEMRVLIVDDDEDHLELLSDVFKTHMPEVIFETARDGFEAGKKVAAFKPKVVLLDLLMPGVDGFKACRSIKESDNADKVRVIAMTGYMTDENVRKIKHAGAETCLEKPLNMGKLMELMGKGQPAFNVRL